MSGHSKWANIKNRKGAQDKKRSEAFTRASRNIMTALRLGGVRLKTAIDQAKEVNMPKENIERLSQRYEERKANLSNCRFEGFGPFGVPLIMEIETDNKNRTLSEVKLLFRKLGGNLASEGSVIFMFERVGEIEIEGEFSEEEQLGLIETGVKEIEGRAVVLVVVDLDKISAKIKEMGKGIGREEIEMRCKQKVKLASEEEVVKVMDLIEALEENDDVINVYSGFEFR